MPEMPTRPPAQRALTVCADDFGLSAGIAEATLALARQGRISAVSCMVGAPHWRAGAAQLRLLDAKRLDVGLHLDLTAHPLDGQLRRGLGSWLLRSHLALLPRAALQREIEGQLDAFEQVLGRAPAHVDGHQHVHQLPGVRAALLAVLAQRYPRERPWLRCTRRPPGAGVGKPWLIEHLGGQGLARRARQAGFEQNGHLLGVYDFSGDAARYLALLGNWLRSARTGDVLMCHPASHPLPGDAIAPARAVEYAVLAGPAFGALLAACGVAVQPLARRPGAVTTADRPS